MQARIHLLIAIAVCAFFYTRPETTWAAPFKLGISAPLTGENADWGNDLKNVLEFANAKLGGGRYQLILEDDHCKNSDAITAAHKLIRVDRVAAAFGLCSTTVIAAAPVFEKARVLLMAPLSTATDISTAGEFVFRTGLSDAHAAAKLYSFIAGRHQHVGILSENNSFSQGFLRDFSMTKQDGKLKITNFDYNPTETDYRPVLLMLQRGKIDSLLINSNSERVFTLILKQLNELRFKIPLYGAYLPGSKVFHELNSSVPNEIYFVDYPAGESLLTAEGQLLFTEFKQKYGAPKSADYAFPAIFEAFRVVDWALQSGQKLPAAIYEQDFRGIFGSYSFDRNGDLRGLSHQIKLRKIDHVEVVE